MSPFDPHTTPTRYLTADTPGTGGVLKQSDDDFLVEELPAYHPSGEGEHLYLWVQKRHMSTMHVVRLLADHFSVRRDAVGFAGLKDKLAVTTQLFSIHLPGKSEASFTAFEHPNVQILWTDRHANKLRRGHLLGNRFIIRIRQTSAAKVVHAGKTLATLARLGVPNRIGTQRFGLLQNNHIVGRALLRGDPTAAIDAILGPSCQSPETQHAARDLYAQGKFDQALTAYTGGAHTERRLLSALARGASPQQAIGAIERTDYGFYLTAFQSAIFNALLDDRIERNQLAALIDGDLAFKHDSGAVFPITPDMPAADREALPARLARLEVSPSGPMWGKDMTRAAGEVAQRERAALDAAGVPEDLLNALSRRQVESMVGQRRPLRVPLRLPDVEAGVDDRGDYIKCIFELPRGAFATTVMQEIMKTDLSTVGQDDE
ncbi:MAG TPA: tRNA pseudouridine(13) synthase TruD [Phycisphaerales bacterium]|nr:tRNA pseudouridine(13) synthase TruD [Phycisphaerales bacterium]